MSGGTADPRDAACALVLLLLSPPHMGNLLWLIIIILIILWIGGFSFQVGGSLIHILLVIALVLLIIRLATGRRVL